MNKKQRNVVITNAKEEPPIRSSDIASSNIKCNPEGQKGNGIGHCGKNKIIYSDPLSDIKTPKQQKSTPKSRQTKKKAAAKIKRQPDQLQVPLKEVPVDPINNRETGPIRVFLITHGSQTYRYDSRHGEIIANIQ